MSAAQTCARLEEVFRSELQGQPLLTNDFVKWLNFILVKNRRWSAGRTVLLGDALHTAHFSIGSGTKLALEDAIALARCFESSQSVESALAAFERTRKPVIEQYQAAAMDSLRWFENVQDDIDLAPLAFAYRLMTRSGRVDHEKLKRRDPVFVEAVERART
jgi:anthraniloyl-CoA monooxygenase